MRKKQIPEWFNLELYADVENLSLAGWLDNLQPRSYWFHGPTDEDSWITKLMRKRNTPIGKPVVTDGKYARQTTLSQSAPYDDVETPEFETGTVRSLRTAYVVNKIADVLYRREEFDQVLGQIAEKWWADGESTRLDDDIIDDDTRLILEQPIDELERRLSENAPSLSLSAEIDLAAPDKIIIEDFRRWIKSARETFSIQSRSYFTDAMLESWSRNRLLPFIDLTIWARENNTNISDAAMGNTLFPDEFDVDLPERIRKVVRPKAHWIMQKSVLTAIEAQVMRPE